MPPSYAQAVREEEERISREYSTPEDIPTCTSILDEYLRCYAIGQQVKSLYRFGQMRQCPQKWADFKFCMSMKGSSAEEKRRLWIKRRAEWWAERRVDRSSEDVWDVRTTPLPPPPMAEDGTAPRDVS